MERVYVDILLTSVRQLTQPCCDGPLHIGEGAVAPTDLIAPDSVEPDGLLQGVDVAR